MTTTVPCLVPSRLSSGAVAFVPRRLASPPFDPSTSCRQDSDCGSSSGLGGMKTQELVSDEAGSTSSEAQPVTYQRPNSLSPGIPCNPPIPLNIIPAWVHPTPAGTNNDLFVHVQVGEVLSIVVGQDIQHITGPATVRMVGESGVSPSALPIQVPQGHMVHQIVDEQGILRHLILSPETPARYPSSAATPSSGFASSRYSSPPVPPYHSSFYTVNRKWSHHGGPGPANKHNHHMPDVVPSAVEPEEDIDPEECVRVKEMLSRILSPSIIRVTSSEADIAWQQLDTSEAAAPGGPFPQIDASEFTYHIVLFESSGRFVSTYRCEPETGNNLRLCQLRPNMDYYVQLKATLEERGLAGEPSQPVCFKTAPGRPEAPLMPRLMSKGSDWISIGWRSPTDNGATVMSYTVFMAKEGGGDDTDDSMSLQIPIDKYTEMNETSSITLTDMNHNQQSLLENNHSESNESNQRVSYFHESHGNTETADEMAEKIWEGRVCEARIANLRPLTTYRFRVTATNRIGESSESPVLVAVTRSDAPPSQPPPPSIVAVNQRTVKLAWNNNMELEYTVEMVDVAAGNSISTVKERSRGCVAQLADLNPGCEYRFRLQSHNMEGDSPKSEWTTVRTSGKSVADRAVSIPERVIVPSMPTVISQNKKKLEIAWKCNGARDREFTYHLEGSTFNHPDKFRTLYKGPLCLYLLTEDDLQNLRVQTIAKKGTASSFSPLLVLPRREDDPIEKPAQPATPIVEGAGRGTVRVRWNTPRITVPPSASLMYEVRRVDEHSEIVYSGEVAECSIEGLGNRQHVEVQVRAVVVSSDGSRHEGDWSGVAGGSAPREPPKPPKDIWLAQDMSALHWNAPDQSADLRYRVECRETRDGQTVDERVFETRDCRHLLSHLEHARQYECKVFAYHDGGESSASDSISINTPAGVPAQPESVSVEAEGTQVLVIRWTAPDCRGEPILLYRIHVESKGQTISDSSHSFPVSPCEHRLTGLLPDTLYRIEISARNSIGCGVSAAIAARTRSLPPPPPRLEADSEVNVLRLRWKPVSTSGMLSYKIVRLSESDTQTTVYDGDQCKTKVRGLHENTEYRFRIRSTDIQTGSGEWSEVFSFRTLVAPPPSVKSPPTATISGNGYYQIEWTPVIPRPNPRKVFYRLQAVDCSLDNGKWHTVFEGGLSSYTLRVSDYPSAVQARVLCVRSDGDEEVLSPPSPVVYMVNQKPQQPPIVERVEVEVAEEPTSWWHLRADRGVTSLAIVIFVLFSLVVALVCDSLFNLRDPPEVRYADIPEPPPREL